MNMHARGSHARGSHSRRAAWASSCRPGMPSLLLPSSSSLLVFVLDRDRRQRVAVAFHTPSLRPPLLAARRSPLPSGICANPTSVPRRSHSLAAIPFQLIFVFLLQKQQHTRLNSSACGSVSGVWLSTAHTVLISLLFPPPVCDSPFSRSFRSFRSLIPHLLFPAVLFLVDNDEEVALGFQLFNLDPATAQVQPLSNLFSTNIRSQPALGLLLHLAPFQPAETRSKGKHDEKLN